MKKTKRLFRKGFFLFFLIFMMGLTTNIGKAECENQNPYPFPPSPCKTIWCPSPIMCYCGCGIGNGLECDKREPYPGVQ